MFKLVPLLTSFQFHDDDGSACMALGEVGCFVFLFHLELRVVVFHCYEPPFFLSIQMFINQHAAFMLI